MSAESVLSITPPPADWLPRVRGHLARLRRLASGLHDETDPAMRFSRACTVESVARDLRHLIKAPAPGWSCWTETDTCLAVHKIKLLVRDVPYPDGPPLLDCTPATMDKVILSREAETEKFAASIDVRVLDDILSLIVVDEETTASPPPPREDDRPPAVNALGNVTSEAPSVKLRIPRGRLDETAAIEQKKNPALTFKQLAAILGCREGTLRDAKKCPLLAAAKAMIQAERDKFRDGSSWRDRRPDDDEA